ncbi:hypothetical protein TELCIR_07437, partial [Teladorsagia circumcincta]
QSAEINTRQVNLEELSEIDVENRQTATLGNFGPCNQRKLHHADLTTYSPKALVLKKRIEPISLDQLVNCEQDISTLMGFTGFNTTKNKKVHVNYDGAVKINKPRRYRQYMNRKGGFNRPLDYIA